MEVADASSARGSGNNDSNNCSARLSWAGAVAMSATSLLFAWFAAGTLRRCVAMDEEEVFSGVLWGLSPLIWAYLFCWTVTLSPRAKDDVAAAVVFAVPACALLLAVAANKLDAPVAGAAAIALANTLIAFSPARAAAGGTVFVATACLILLADAATKLIAPVAGAAAIVLAPLLAACVCGRALAERLQRTGGGTEPWSAAAVASTPSYRSRAEEVNEREHNVHAVAATEIVAVAGSACVWFTSWLAPEETAKWEAPPTEVVFFLAGPLLLASRLWLPCVVGNNPVLAAVDDMLAMAAVFGVFGWLVVAAVARALFGAIAGTLVLWMGELGMAGILGYFLAVEAHYKELMVIKRKEPRRAKDASGLLDGRDSGDVCSAHIDMDAGVDCVLPRWC